VDEAFDPVAHNRVAWDREVDSGNEWTRPVAADVIARARAGAGAAVTVFDNSPRQLGRDEEVAARDGLAIRTVLGDMRDLSAFPDASFDVVFNPVSNVFCPTCPAISPLALSSRVTARS